MTSYAMSRDIWRLSVITAVPAGVQRGVASKMSTAYLRRAFYSLWMAGWPSAAGWLSGAAMGSGVAMDMVHCMQFAWAFLAPWFRFPCFGRILSQQFVV